MLSTVCKRTVQAAGVRLPPTRSHLNTCGSESAVTPTPTPNPTPTLQVNWEGGSGVLPAALAAPTASNVSLWIGGLHSGEAAAQGWDWVDGTTPTASLSTLGLWAAGEPRAVEGARTLVKALLIDGSQWAREVVAAPGAQVYSGLCEWSWTCPAGFDCSVPGTKVG
jgi:hypothetical protein